MNVPVETPIQGSLGNISTTLGIITAIAGLFFKQNETTKGEDTATDRLLSDIAKRRKRNGYIPL